jgi:hypothetical protein
MPGNRTGIRSRNLPAPDAIDRVLREFMDVAGIDPGEVE